MTQMPNKPQNPMAGPAGEASSAPPWSQVWQLPMLLLGLVLFVVGVVWTIQSRKGPDYNAWLERTSKLVNSGEYDQAHEELKALEPAVAQIPASLQGQYWLLTGDLIYHQQRVKGWDVPENHEKTIQAYTQAHKLKTPIDSIHILRWAETLAALSQDDEAIQLLQSAPPESPESKSPQTSQPSKLLTHSNDKALASQRYRVIRQIIERRMAAQAVPPQSLSGLLNLFAGELAKEPDPALRRTQEIWLAGVRAQLQLAQGPVDRVVESLQRQILVFMADGKDSDLAPLLLLLAQTCQKAGDLAAAERNYKLVIRKAAPENRAAIEWIASATTGLGQLAMIRANAAADPKGYQQALTYFTEVETQYKDTQAYLDALYGRIDAMARLAMHPQALELLGQLVSRVGELKQGVPAWQTKLITLVRQHHRLCADRGEFERALQYLTKVQSLFKDDMPTVLVRELAQAHYSLGLQTMADAMDQPIEPLPADVESLAPTSPQLPIRRRLMIRSVQLFDQAGELYLRHAKLLTINDLEIYSQSLWQASVAFERGQQWKKTIDALGMFIKALPTDSRRQSAMNRLALAYVSDGQPAVAADLFNRLIDEHPRSPEAYASLVPLARCLIALNKLDHAQRVLQHVVTDHPAIGPDNIEYRQALTELGRLLYRQKHYEAAIEKLTEAVQRYGQTSDGPLLRFTLADAYRQSVVQVQSAMVKDSPNQARRQALAIERIRRLEQAQKFYSQVVSDLEPKPANSLSDMETLALRNSYLYRADCVYDMGRFEQAIQLYDLAAKRFDNQPASLMALVQIVNAYSELGRAQEARVANDRARSQLKRIPESAFDDPSLPMNRQHWDDWLRWTSQLNLFETQASVGS